jgi:DNA-binding Lrp family transcriptional regulator
MPATSNKERRLLTEIQNGFPLTRRPYRTLAEKFNMKEREVLDTVKRLADAKYIRRIGAFIETRKIGVSSALVSMKVPAPALRRVVREVNSLPGVTHNYLRTGKYNLWFSLSGASGKALQRTLTALKRKTGVREMLYLPAERIFKIKATFKPLV